MMGIRLFSVIGVLFFTLNQLTTESQTLPKGDMEEIFEQVDFSSIYYSEKAQVQFDSVMYYMDTKQMIDYEGYINYLKAKFSYNNMEVDSSLNYVERALAYFTKRENDVWSARCQFLLGNIAESSGLYEQAKINYYEALRLVDVHDNITKGAAYIGIARCKRALEESFVDESSMGITLLRNVSQVEVRLYADFMKQYFRLKEKDAPAKLNAIANEYVERKLYDRAVSVYKVLASSYHGRQQYDSAHFYCDRAIEISESNNVGKLILPAMYQFKGMLYFKQDMLDTADAYFRKSLALYKNNHQTNRMSYVYNYLHQVDKMRGDYLKAYEDLEAYIELVEKTSSSEKVRLAKVLEINNKVELMKSQLVQLKVEKRASEFMLYLVLIITIVLLSGVGVYVYLYQKSKKAKINELNKEFHNLLIGIGEKQLLQHRLSSSSKHRGMGDAGSGSQLFRNMDEYKDLDNKGLSDNFDSCYLETINLFTEAFPQLTKTEIRYAVMICLRLPMEIIAKVQSVQPASVRKAKQRIRAKLNVIDSLEDYLQDFREKQISNLAG